ncbi:hypothetical protein [Sphingosinithalassobacter portus]|uniref:hypothetical protein n=1 Tax=Stakelama portus TaxID=2676234 RepID=UPI0011AB8CD1|nr:hypothetical protein [Sphingosinithalassobacter portus]
MTDLILKNAKVTTLDRANPQAEAIAVRGGLNYNMELRWDGVPTLADAMIRDATCHRRVTRGSASGVQR